MAQAITELAIPAWLAALVAAPFVGSFLGVLVVRLPAHRPVALARSVCDVCGHILSPVELVPVVSFIALRGRCRHCTARIAPVHLEIELAALLVAAWAVSAAPDPPLLWSDCVLGWTLLALAWIDYGHLRLPDAVTLPLIVLGLACTWLLAPWALLSHAIATIIGYLALSGVAVAYRLLRGRVGLGGGDIKLFAAAGAWVGLDGLAPVLLGAAVCALALAIAIWIVRLYWHPDAANVMPPQWEFPV
jgi:leader peptidase (prepilin peptidase)/N-methyltransferase